MFLTGESQGWEAWWAAVYGVAELNTTKVTQQHSSVGKDSACNAETRVRFLGQEDPLQKEMATRSSILAWRIPGMGSLVGCRLWGRRVGHD